MFWIRRHVWSLAVICVFGFVEAASALPPTVSELSLHGLQVGSVTRIVVSGTGLSPDARLVLAAPITSQSVVEGSTAERLELDVELGQATPGIYPAWIATGSGLSRSFYLGVDNLPQSAATEAVPNLPAAVSGHLAGNQVFATHFAGSAGKPIVIEVEARRLGGGLKPTIHLLDPLGTQLAWRGPNPALDGDTRVEAVLPEDGEYTLNLHDELYSAEGASPFRVKIGDFEFADAVFPLAASRGETATVRFASARMNGAGLASIPPECGLPMAPIEMPYSETWSGPLPGITVSDFPEVVEMPGVSGIHPLPAPPVGVSATLSQLGEKDRFRLPVEPGSKLRIEVLADRVGSPLDGVMNVLNASGESLATADDQPDTKDPALDFDVPADVEQVDIEVSDLQSLGGADFVYRLTIQPSSVPDFQVRFAETSKSLPLGGVVLLPITIERRGYDGAVDLSVEGLPENCQVAGTRVPPGVVEAKVSILTDEPLTDIAWLRIHGRSADGTLTRVALAPATPATRKQPWLRERIPVWNGGEPEVKIQWAQPAPRRLFRGSTSPLQLVISRTPESSGNLRLSILSNQSQTKKKDRNVFGQEVDVDDPDRMLRLANEVILEPNASPDSVQLLVPPDLPERVYQVVLRGELLEPDNKTVRASFYSPGQEIEIRPGLELSLASNPSVEAKAGDGPTGVLRGSVRRPVDSAAPVKVTLAGLPNGVEAPEVVLPPAQTEFVLSARLPYETAPGELKGVSLQASTLAEADNPDSRVASAPIPVTVNVVPGLAPPAFRPLDIFEDQAGLLAELVQGSGDVSLVASDRHSGYAALRVQGGERAAAIIRGLSVAIRENPKAGEYRFLRFAWKKPAGGAVALSVAEGGAFKRDVTERHGLTYSAGGTWPTPSIAVAEASPTEWQVVTRDLFADFGELQLTGIGFDPSAGGTAYFDHIYLGRSVADLDAIPGR